MTMRRTLLVIVIISLVPAYMIQLIDVAILKNDHFNLLEVLAEVLASGTIIYLHFFIPFLLLSVLLVFFISFLKCHTGRCCIGGSALFGFVLAACFVLDSIIYAWYALPYGGIGGAICGWIYWAIAIRSALHAISTNTDGSGSHA